MKRRSFEFWDDVHQEKLIENAHEAFVRGDIEVFELEELLNEALHSHLSTFEHAPQALLDANLKRLYHGPLR